MPTTEKSSQTAKTHKCPECGNDANEPHHTICSQYPENAPRTAETHMLGHPVPVANGFYFDWQKAEKARDALSKRIDDLNESQARENERLKGEIEGYRENEKTALLRATKAEAELAEVKKERDDLKKTEAAAWAIEREVRKELYAQIEHLKALNTQYEIMCWYASKAEHQRDDLLAACQRAAKTFRHYEELHLAKLPADYDKARANLAEAQALEAAIAAAEKTGVYDGKNRNFS